MRNRPMIFILAIALLAAMILTGCTDPQNTVPSTPSLNEDTHPTEPSTFATPESYSVDWEMTAYLIELDGSIAASFPLGVTDEMWSEGPNFYHDLALHVSEEVYDYFPYMINGGDAEDNPQRRDMYDKPGDFRVDGYILDRRDSTPARAQLVLNLENEYFLGWFGEEYGRLLVACVDPNEGSADVLAHFQQYLELRRIKVQIDSIFDGNIDWNLHGVWVSSDGTVQTGQEGVNFSLSGTLPIEYELQSLVTGTLEFTWPEATVSKVDGENNSVYANLAAKHENQHIYHGVTWIHYLNVNDFSSISFTICAEDEFVVMHIGNEDRYLVASTDPNADPAEIFAFYKTYVHVSQ